MNKEQKKIAVITGGAKGIGRCLVQEFSRAGYSVYFMDIDAAIGQAVAEQSGSQFFEGGVQCPSTLAAFAEHIAAKAGRVDVLINNAMGGHLGGLQSNLDWAGFNAALHTGLTAPYELTRLLLPLMPQGASVINMCSTRAFQSQANTEAYAAIKGGINALTHAMAASLSGRVRVNAISPGWVDTRAWQGGIAASDLGHSPTTVEAPEAFSPADCAQHFAGRIGEPSDIARLALFLADPANSFISAQNIIADGGMSRRMIYHADEGWNFEN